MHNVSLSLFAVCMLALSIVCHPTSLAASGRIPIQTTQDSSSILYYTIDTVESYSTGPGVQYTHFTINNGSSVRKCYMYDVDLSNPYIRVEETHATTLGKTELMTATHQRLDSAQHRSIGSVNCNFWYVSNDEGLLGVAATGQVRNGKIGASITNWNIGRGTTEEERKQEVGYLMMDTEGKAWIDQYAWNSTVRIGQTSKALREANRNRNNPNTNEIVLFNSDLGTNATRQIDDVYEVIADMVCPWAINEELHAIVVDTNATGGTLIKDNQVVFQARGTRKTFMRKAAIGDTIHFTIGIYTALTEDYPTITQLSAGNCLVMKDGRLTIRNWNETYNNQNYPRTGFGVTADHQRLFMLVMEKPGMYTHEMCSILRHFGASDAMGADGGGSAQFNLAGRILNPTTEATPRPVSNAVFLFSTAPDDNIPDTLTYHNSLAGHITLPTYSSFTPQIRAYNQYGVLITNEYDAYTLECVPASLGTISSDGRTFTASATGGEGILIATAGDAYTQIPVTIEQSQFHISVDSVICDLRPYQVELYTTSATASLPINPSFGEWDTSDPTICTISDSGVLQALQCGQAYITCTLDGNTDTLIVNAQIPEQDHVASGVLVDTIVQFDSPRGAYVEIPFNCLLFGCPDSVQIHVQSDATIKSADATISAADTKVHSISVELQPNKEQQTYYCTLLPEDFSNAHRAESYPFYIESIEWLLSDISRNTDYHFTVTDIICYYSSFLTPEGTALVTTPANSVKVLQDGKVLIIHDGTTYTIHGTPTRQ